MIMRPNPPWADKVLRDNLADLLAEVGEDLLPRESYGNPGTYPELGRCGSYGCVYHTRTPGVVLKITVDSSEAAFVAACLAHRIPWPAGIVRYLGVVELAGNVRVSTLDGTTAYALWREEAFNVGGILDVLSGEEIRPLYRLKHAARDVQAHLPGGVVAGEDTLEDLDHVLSAVDEWLASGRWTDARIPFAGEIQEALDQCRRAARAVLEIDGLRPVGEAILAYMGHGMLLGDVHPQNTGTIKRGKRELIGITDPGVMIPLRPEFAEVAVPRVGARYALPRMLANRRSARRGTR